MHNVSYFIVRSYQTQKGNIHCHLHCQITLMQLAFIFFKSYKGMVAQESHRTWENLKKIKLQKQTKQICRYTYFIINNQTAKPRKLQIKIFFSLNNKLQFCNCSHKRILIQLTTECYSFIVYLSICRQVRFTVFTSSMFL